MHPWRWDVLDELITLRESMEHLFEEIYSCRPPLFRDAPVMWETEMLEVCMPKAGAEQVTRVHVEAA